MDRARRLALAIQARNGAPNAVLQAISRRAGREGMKDPKVAPICLAAVAQEPRPACYLLAKADACSWDTWVTRCLN